MKGVRGVIAMLSTPAPGHTYVATGISVGADTSPAETSTGAVPSNRGTTPESATIETSSVSGEVTIATRRSRSSSRASGGRATVVSATVSATGRTTTNRTRSMARPNDASPEYEGKIGATATRA